MFIKFDDESVRLTGRWYKGTDSAVATATGSTIEFAFKGKMAVIHFDMTWSENPYPHIWIIVDGGAKIEVPMDTYIRIDTENDCEHTVKIIYKSGVEMQHRWYSPLIGKIAFRGVDVDSCAKLPADNRKTIEFVGDSITEGVLIDIDYTAYKNDQHNRVYKDDVTATYAYLTSRNLNLKPIFMGYGAVGITKGGCGSVPKVLDAYPYCFDNAPISHKSADFIMINHGANDQRSTVEEYISGYEELLNLIRKMNPNSKIIVLSAFCGAFSDDLEKFVPSYNAKFNDDVFYVNTAGWIPKEPLHPLRDGHITVSENLTKILREKFDL